MRKLLGVASLLTVALPLVAVAQPPPPPPPGGGGGGMVGPAPAAEPKMRLDVGLFVAMEQSDDLQNIDPSPGIDLAFGFTVAPNASIFGGIRYIAVQISDEADDGTEVAYYDFRAGGRYAFPISPTAKAFVEGFLGYGTVSLENMGQTLDGSGLQFGGEAGAMFKVSGSTSIGGALSYSTGSVELESMGFSLDLDTAWLGIKGFASFGF